MQAQKRSSNRQAEWESMILSSFFFLDKFSTPRVRKRDSIDDKNTLSIRSQLVFDHVFLSLFHCISYLITQALLRSFYESRYLSFLLFSKIEHLFKMLTRVELLNFYSLIHSLNFLVREYYIPVQVTRNEVGDRSFFFLISRYSSTQRKCPCRSPKVLACHRGSLSRVRERIQPATEFLMGIEYVYDITVVAVIADWTIEMVKRGLCRQASRSFGQARPPLHGSKLPRHVLHVCRASIFSSSSRDNAIRFSFEYSAECALL